MFRSANRYLCGLQPGLALHRGRCRPGPGTQHGTIGAYVGLGQTHQGLLLAIRQVNHLLEQRGGDPVDRPSVQGDPRRLGHQTGAHGCGQGRRSHGARQWFCG
jgi:hypothetical protein